MHMHMPRYAPRTHARTRAHATPVMFLGYVFLAAHPSELSPVDTLSGTLCTCVFIRIRRRARTRLPALPPPRASAPATEATH